MARALLIYWNHPYGAVQGPMFAVGDSLREHGVQVDYLAVDRKGYKLMALGKKFRNYDLAIGFGAMALKKTSFGRMWLRFGDIFYFWEVDPFIYGYLRFQPVRRYIDRCRTDKRLRILVPDRSYGNLLGQLTRPDCVRFFPFGGFGGEAIAGSKSQSARFAVFATLGQELAIVKDSFREIFAAAALPELTAKGIENLRDRLQDPFTGINVTEEFLAAFDLGVEALLRPEIITVIGAVDAFEKRRRRYEVSKWLLEQKIELDFYGMGWETFRNYPTARICGLTQESLQEKLPYYMGVVNFDPNWNDGYHDRVFTGLSCGARVIATPNRARTDILSAGGETLSSALFDYDQEGGALANRIEEWKKNRITPDVVTAFYQQHSWNERVGHLLSQK